MNRLSVAELAPLALAGARLAVADWLRARAVRFDLAAVVIAVGATVLPFAWLAIIGGVLG